MKVHPSLSLRNTVAKYAIKRQSNVVKSVKKCSIVLDCISNRIGINIRKYVRLSLVIRML